jgi:hypothetical protein
VRYQARSSLGLPSVVITLPRQHGSVAGRLLELAERAFMRDKCDRADSQIWWMAYLPSASRHPPDCRR